MANKQGTNQIVDAFIGDKLIEARYIGQTKYFDPYTTLTGTLPLSFNSRVAGALKNYRLYGDSDGAGVQTENLFDKDAKDTSNGYVNNYYLNSDGIELSSTACYITEYIAVAPNTTYTLYRGTMSGSSLSVCEYDANKEYVNGTSYNSRTAVTITTGQNTTYIRASIYKVNTEATMFTLGSTAPTTYIPYGYQIPILISDKKPEIYGWHVDPSISDPARAITYLGDAVGKTPAAMGASTFSYGDWSDAFFMPRPCMVKSNGTVDYYLDPNDYTKKLDGTASDVADASYDGNAMMEWPLIWWKYEAGETEGEGYFYVSNVKVDNTYNCYCNINCDNQIVEHFYTAIYNGTGTTKLRSISGVALTSANGNGGTTYSQESTRALANNTTAKTEWFIDVWSDRMLINGLLILMGKSLDSQATFGRGIDTGAQAAKEAYITGALNEKGLFWGNISAGTSGVKVFGMENWWGCALHRIAGLIGGANSQYAYKMTWGTYDGTTATGYNTTATGYKTVGTRPASGFFNKATFGQFGYLPVVTSASSASTYYCDYYNDGTGFALGGGSVGSGVNGGASCVYLNIGVGSTYWSFAAALTLKPLANPVTPHASNYDLMIGSTKLGAEEYVDYESGKVYKLKEVHKDTVTINGIEWDILGYDQDTVYKSDNTLAQRCVTIQTHDCINELQFDAKEAMFAFDEGLAAGTYHFTVGAQPWVSGDVGKTVQFTLTSDIPAGGQIVFGNAYNATMIGATISVFAGPTATTASETATLSEGTDGTDLGTLTNAINGAMNSVQRGFLGSNNYNESVIRQYLNSDKAAGSVWAPQTKWDRPPSWATSIAGLLYRMDPEFISVIGKVKKRTAKNTVSDGGGYIDTEEKIFLLSRTEVYAGTNNSVDEGGPYRYFSEFSDLSSAGTGADSNRTKYRNNVAKYWWLRSPTTGSARDPFGVSPLGMVISSLATNSFGVAPVCCIILDDISTNPYLQSLFYKPTDPPAPLPAISVYRGENTLSSTETLGEVTVKGRIRELNYKRLSYLKSSDGSAYINTDITGLNAATDYIEAEMSFGALDYIEDGVVLFGCATLNDGHWNLFGASCDGYGQNANDRNNSFFFNVNYSTGGSGTIKRMRVNTSGDFSSKLLLSVKTPQSTITNLETKTIYTPSVVNPNKDAASLQPIDFVQTASFTMFAAQYYRSVGDVVYYKSHRNVSCYGTRIYRNNILIHNLIPSEREDGELGLLDTITNKFYTNAGTGTFEKGEYI